MTITGFDLYRYTLPLTAPLMLRGKQVYRREGAVVRMTCDERVVGWGEASPLPGFSRETLAEAERDLRAIRSHLMGRDVTDHPLDPDSDLVHVLDRGTLCASARFAIELAAWEGWTQAAGRIMSEVFNVPSRPVVALNGLVMGRGEDALKAARRMRQDGFRAVKLKVGRQPVTDDVALVRAVAAVLGGDVALRLDANRAWSPDHASVFAQGVAGCSIEYVEEPLADPTQLPAFAQRHDLPVALDETLLELHPGDLRRHEFVRAIVLKPMLLGGFVPALRWVQQAETMGITPVLSAAFETGLGLRGLIALAAGLPDVPVGLDTYRRLADDVLTPRLSWQAGRIDVPALMQVPRRVKTEMLHAIDAR